MKHQLYLKFFQLGSLKKTCCLWWELCLHCRTVVESVQKLQIWILESCSLTICPFILTAMTAAVIPNVVLKGVAMVKLCTFGLQMLSLLSIFWGLKVSMQTGTLCLWMRRQKHEVHSCLCLSWNILCQCWFLLLLEADLSVSETPLLR